jgi:hypothetical protein
MLNPPVRYDMQCHRAVKFTERVQRIGDNWTGATLHMQVRLTPDVTGTPVLNLTLGSGLTLEYAGTATVAAHIAAGRLPDTILGVVNANTGVNYVGTDNVTLSSVLISVAASGADVFPFPAERGDVVTLYYDLTMDPDGAGLNTQKVTYGTFTLMPTVTR